MQGSPYDEQFVYETDAGTFRIAGRRKIYTTRAQAEIVAGVFQYALDHYESDGWDEVVECWDGDDVLREIGRARTVAGAIRKIRPGVKLRAEYAAEIASTAF